MFNPIKLTKNEWAILHYLQRYSRAARKELNRQAPSRSITAALKKGLIFVEDETGEVAITLKGIKSYNSRLNDCHRNNLKP